MKPRSRPSMSDVLSLMGRGEADAKHTASSDSTVDLLWVLYDRILKFDPDDPATEGRDRFVMSKGHGPLAFYAVLCAHGFFPSEWLDGFGTWGNPLGLHPDRQLVPGVEVSTGSLGHGLPMAIGMALAVRAKGLASRVFVLCGDGELNEGSNWEAMLLAAHLRIGLTLIVIDNRSSSIPVMSWEERLGAFGWDTRVVRATDHSAVSDALTWTAGDRPLAVVVSAPGLSDG